jgi:hypothetical protein
VPAKEEIARLRESQCQQIAGHLFRMDA